MFESADDNLLNEEQQKEIKALIDEITQEAKHVVEDYVNNPSDMSGSIHQVHENSPYLATREERLFDTTGKRVDFKEESSNVSGYYNIKEEDADSRIYRPSK